MVMWDLLDFCESQLPARCCRSLLSRALRRSFVEPVIRPSRSIFGGRRSAERTEHQFAALARTAAMG